MTVDAVEADVELSAQVPLRVRRLPFEQLRERLEPGDPLLALPLPELFERQVVDVGLRVGLGREVLGRRIAPLLEEESVDCLLLGCRHLAPYAGSLRGVGATAGISPQSGRPTGTIALADIPLTTPAADAYHATRAVMIPAQPPTWTQ